MPSFDVVSQIDLQEVDNAVHQVEKEIQHRFDFKDSKSTIKFDKTKNELMLLADSELRMDALNDVLQSKLIKRGIEITALDFGKVEQAGGMTLRQVVKLKQGLDQPTAKSIVKIIKETGLKVDASIQKDQLRVTAKKIDDLQAVIAKLKESSSHVGVPLQYINMRS